MKKFRVLFLYPNGKLMNPPPIAIGIFTALLRENGFEVDLFDTTLYSEPGSVGSDDAKKENLQVRPFDYGSRGVKLKERPIAPDLLKKIEEFRPDLIAISILECTYSAARAMLQAIEKTDIPVIAGGVFPTFAAEKMLMHKNVRMVCRGEGEGALVEVCQRMAAGKDCDDVENLCVKRNGRLVQNRIRKPVDINSLPVSDFSLFEEARFFRPMAGKVYKTIPIETNRGCPYTCSFCNSPSTSEMYRENGCKFFRTKSMTAIQRELRHLKKQWDAEYVYFSSDNFLVNSDAEFNQFLEIYKEINLPFWVQSRPETITEYRAKKLKEIGCHRISLGLEHGNDEFRKKVLKKKFDNEVMIRASKILADAGIPLTVNNMIGFPDETRELIFDTIELNRQLVTDTMNCAVFAPFHGTPLQKLCVERGYVSEDTIFGSINVDIPLNMPQLTQEDIRGIRRTFSLYVRLPKSNWPQIRRAEKFDEEGNRIFAELSKMYQEKYFK
ncbi:MAG TPA: radical SAM protein [Candidatus Omnitrophota bacterium]|nr:radical SAM protein [Candidatus Omnitrophota bacterium]HPD84092.1 radical SAM protein [Candidatus Omnitrophota bacterium]HRZ02949.1 radical SAM protein [Candidatus Omnitrophota bacterium]